MIASFNSVPSDSDSNTAQRQSADNSSRPFMSQNTDRTDRMKIRINEVLWLGNSFDFATDSLFC
jgi:hypothetical protein